MALGVAFNENMYGTYRRLDNGAGEQPFVFHVDALSTDLFQTLRDGRVQTSGFVEAPGLATHSSIRGFMIIKPAIRRIVRYEFDFTADDGQLLHFAGEKTIRHLSPMRTWTTLPGSIHDASGREIAHCVTRFRVEELGTFLRTFRLQRPSAVPQLA